MGSKKEKKVFISHSSKDNEYITAFVTRLLNLGLTGRQIICTSDSRCCNPNNGEDVTVWLDNMFNSCELYVLIMMSDSYQSSRACPWELGATRDAPERQVILLPGFDVNNLGDSFGINPHKISIKLDDDEAMLKRRMSELKTSLEQFFSDDHQDSDDNTDVQDSDDNTDVQDSDDNTDVQDSDDNTDVLKAAETIFAKMRSLAGKDSKAYEEFKALFKDTSEEEIELQFSEKYPAAAHYVKQVCTLFYTNENDYYVELDFYTVGKGKSGTLEILQRETSFLSLYYEDGQWWIKESPADRLPDECFPDGFAEAYHAGRKAQFFSPNKFMYCSEKSVYEGIVHAEVIYVWENAGNSIECALWLANGLKQNVYFKEIEVVIRNEKEEEILHGFLHNFVYPVLVAGYSTVTSFEVPDKLLANGKNGRRRWNKCEQVRQETRIIDYEIL